MDDVIAECRDVARAGYRALVTVLTKKMAEDLSEFMHEQGLRVRYMHNDVDTLERIEIIRDPRLALIARSIRTSEPILVLKPSLASRMHEGKRLARDGRSRSLPAADTRRRPSADAVWRTRQDSNL